MIYRNDNIKITDTYVIGSIKDLKEYFRYEIASQCMKFDFDYENFSDNDIVKVSEHPMNSFIIESEWENE